MPETYDNLFLLGSFCVLSHFNLVLYALLLNIHVCERRCTLQKVVCFTPRTHHYFIYCTLNVTRVRIAVRFPSGCTFQELSQP